MFYVRTYSSIQSWELASAFGNAEANAERKEAGLGIEMPR